MLNNKVTQSDIYRGLRPFRDNYRNTIEHLINNHGLAYCCGPINETDSTVCAMQIMKKLIADKKNPELVRFLPRENNKLLIPKGYNDALKWTYHDACRCDGLIFDIIYHRPINLEEYMQTLFHSIVNISKINFS